MNAEIPGVPYPSLSDLAFWPGCSNINFSSILPQFHLSLSSILCLFSIDYEVESCPIEFKHEMCFFSVLSPYLRPPRLRLPHAHLSETSILPQEYLTEHSILRGTALLWGFTGDHTGNALPSASHTLISLAGFLPIYASN